MKIKLNVPKKPDAEIVSVGNHTAKLKPGGSVVTESREFADFLIREHGLSEAAPKAATPRAKKAAPKKKVPAKSEPAKDEPAKTKTPNNTENNGGTE